MAQPSDNNLDYKAFRRKNKGKSDTIIKIVSLTLCVLITVMFASIMTDEFFWGFSARQTNSVKVSSADYFGVSIGSFDNMLAAEKAALNLRARGGAGYIHKENSIKVYAALYLSKADADSVAKRMTAATGVTVNRINLPAYKLSYDSKVIPSKKLTEITGCFENAINFLYDLYIRLDTENINELTATTRITAEKNRIIKLKSDLDAAVGVDAPQDMLLLKAELLSLQINLSILSENTLFTDSLSTHIKSQMFKILFSYKAFIAEIK